MTPVHKQESPEVEKQLDLGSELAEALLVDGRQKRCGRRDGRGPHGPLLAFNACALGCVHSAKDC